MKKYAKKILWWLACFMGYCGGIVLIGALLGVLIGGICYAINPTDTSIWKFLGKSTSIGARFAGVWAGGIAIILCFVQAHKIRCKHDKERKI